MDKYHGVGGSYEVDPITRERKPKDEPRNAEPEGGGPRDEKGEPLNKPDPNARPEPALPEPAPMPWQKPSPDVAAAEVRASGPAPAQVKTKGA